MTDHAAGSRLVGLFNSIGTDFDALRPSLWGPAGQALVDELDIRPGERILDICSGTGASALPAARATGPAGTVVAVDFAAELLDIASTNAADEGLEIDCVVADVTGLKAGTPPCATPFDVVACSFGVFFLPNMDDAVRNVLSLLRPGGRMGASIWHADSLREFSEIYRASVAEVAGETSHQGPRSGSRMPISHIDTEESVSQWFTTLGAQKVDTSVYRLRIECTPDFAWKMVVGTGMRGALTPLDDEQIAQVRQVFLERLASEGPAEINCDTLIAVATV